MYILQALSWSVNCVLHILIKVTLYIDISKIYVAVFRIIHHDIHDFIGK